MKLEEVSEAGSAVNANQDAILHGGAEAHGQAVRARAGPVVGWPGVEDEASTLPKDVGCASCKNKERGSHQGSQSNRGLPDVGTLLSLCRQLWR